MTPSMPAARMRAKSRFQSLADWSRSSVIHAKFFVLR
jgi:hypothetical protein